MLAVFSLCVNGQANNKGAIELLKMINNSKMCKAKMKWECIEGHTGSRTWITRSIFKGVPINVITGICGLKRMNTITRYMDIFGPVNGYSKLLEK